ncbi:MAG TPA: antibiotic biosynthesis monooxygenase, partial [Bacteroidota bacterium]
MLIIIWKFRAKRGQEQTFEQAYGPDGAWVTLFRKGNGYLGTELLRSQDGSYVTIDRWNSQEAYAVFQNDHSSDYQ